MKRRKEIKIFLSNKILVSLKIFVQSPHAQTFRFLYNFPKILNLSNNQNISKNLYIFQFCQNILSISWWKNLEPMFRTSVLVKIRSENPPPKNFSTTHINHRTFTLILLPCFFIYQFYHKFTI